MTQKQLILADSGGTKTDWVVVPEEGRVIQIRTQGLNPYFTKAEELVSVIREQLLPNINRELPYEVHFYGSGCGNPDHCAFFLSVFLLMGAEQAFIETDLLGVAHAALGKRAGIAGILGTGANAGFFANGTLITPAPSTGYVLGDEGSAAWIGKQLLSAWLRGTMPEEIRQVMKTRFQLEPGKVLQQVYSNDRPNRYIASFAAVLNDFSGHPWIGQMLRSGFEAFFMNYLEVLSPRRDIPVIMAGTVAGRNAALLTEIARQKGFEQFSVMNTVIDGLLNYHQSR